MKTLLTILVASLLSASAFAGSACQASNMDIFGGNGQGISKDGSISGIQ